MVQKRKKRRKPFIILLVLFVILAILASFFFAFWQRPQALVVTDTSFLALYGTGRLRQQMVLASLSMFRRVRSVLVADSTTADILVLAIEQAAPQPYCVLFPYRFLEAAERYREQFPDVPVVLLENRTNITSGTDGFWVFRTDRETDSYRAGLCAGIIAGAEPQRIAVFLDRSAGTKEQNAFIRGLRDEGLEIEPLFYYVASQLTNTNDISCVVLLGAGAEILDLNLKVPIILYTWLDPALTSNEIVLVFDDSPWSLAVPVFTMALEETMEQFEGKIPSKPLVFSARIADNRISQSLKEAVKRQYEKSEDDT